MTEMSDFREFLDIGTVFDGTGHVKYIYLGRYRDLLTGEVGYLYGIIGDVSDGRSLDAVDVQTDLSVMTFRSRTANSVFVKQPKKFYRIVGTVNIKCLNHTLSKIWGMERIDG